MNNNNQSYISVVTDGYYSLCVAYFNVKHQKIYVPLNLPTYQSINLSIFYLCIALSIHPSVYPSIPISFCLPVCLFIHLYKYLHVYVLSYVLFIYIHNYVPICVHSYAHIPVLTYAPMYIPIHLCSYLFTYTSNMNNTPKIHSPLKLRLIYQKLLE